MIPWTIFSDVRLGCRDVNRSACLPLHPACSCLFIWPLRYPVHRFLHSDVIRPVWPLYMNCSTRSFDSRSRSHDLCLPRSRFGPMAMRHATFSLVCLFPMPVICASLRCTSDSPVWLSYERFRSAWSTTVLYVCPGPLGLCAIVVIRDQSPLRYDYLIARLIIDFLVIEPHLYWIHSGVLVWTRFGLCAYLSRIGWEFR